MAVVTVKSTAITNRDASPAVLSNAYIARADLKEASGTVTVTSGDSIASKYIFCQVPSGARISQVLLYAVDIGTTTAGDVGLYRTTRDGGAVVDVDYFASAQALNAGPYQGVDISIEAAAAGGAVANRDLRIWEVLALTADPMIMYDVVLTLTGAADGTGACQLVVRWAE